VTTLLGDARIRVRPDFEGFEQESKRRFAGMAPVLGTALKGALVGTGAVLAAAGMVGLQTAAQLETAKIGFTTMLGSATKADAFLRNLADFAAKTPFEFPELQSAASKLISVGTEASRVIPLMTVLGDSTAAMGTGADGINRAVMALQQMRVKGKVTGEEMLQLAEAGVPAWEALATQLGVTTAQAQEMVTKGKVSVDDLFKAIETRQGKTLQRTKGMMEAQSNSISGLWSTLKDTVQMRLAQAIQPLVPYIKKALKEAAPLFDGILGGISSGMEKGIKFIEGTVAPLIRNIMGQLGKGGGPLKPLVDGFRAFADEVGPPAVRLFGALVDFGKALWPTLRQLGQQIMEVVGPALRDIGQVIGREVIPKVVAFLDAFKPVAKFLLEVIGTAVVEALKGAMQFIKGILRVIGGIFDVFTGILTGDWSKAWEGIKSIFSGAWEAILGALRVFLSIGLVGGVKKGATAAWKWFNDIAVSRIGAFGSWLATRPAWIVGKLGALGGFLKNAAIKGFGVFRTWTERKMGEVLSFIAGVPGKIGRSFANLGGIIVGYAASGIGALSSWINDKVIDNLNKLTSRFGLTIPRIPSMAPASSSRNSRGAKPSRAMAAGGVMPGWTPGRDVHRFVSPTAGTLDLSGGEAVMRPEFTRAIGTVAVNALNSAARNGGVSGVRRALSGGFAAGGIIGAGWNKLKGLGSSFKGNVDDLLSKGFGFAVDRMLTPLVRSFSDRFSGAGVIGRLTSGVLTQLVGKLKTWGEGQFGGGVPVGGGGGGSFGSGVQRWAGVVLQALRMLGQPESYLGITLRRMNQESGGNPRAINLWDINAKRGIPSKGLMQTIDPTFNAYAGALRGRGVWDPLANVYASMRYALARYGSLPRAYNRKGGYALGTHAAAPGMAWVGERGPELVDFRGGERVMNARRSSEHSGVTVNVYVDDHRLRDLIRVEVDDNVGRTATALRYGRRN
jgi:tape measure domain-containing protein